VRRAALALLAALLLAGCAHQDLKAPCRHALLGMFAGACGPIRPVQ
jgi:hypothetical protein